MSLSVTDELCVLLVEDNPGDATLFEHHLSTSGTDTFPPATVTQAADLDSALDELATEPYDIVLLDLGLPHSTGLETLDRYNEAVETNENLTPVPVIVLTGLRDDAAAVDAIERGAQDYLLKDDVDGTILHRSIRYAIERHRKEHQLRRQNRRLERFAHVVSHDLRNPLSVAQGRIDMIDDEQTAVIKKNLDRMEAIITDVLTLAREGKTVENTETVALDVVAKQCWAQVETDAAVLSTDDHVRIQADENRCQQLLENLIRNSIDHAGEDVAIHVGELSDGFYFEDDGPGIDPDSREQVFEAGYSTDQDGTGFGLNIVHEIATAHGWSVDITDGSDGGARFEFTGVASA